MAKYTDNIENDKWLEEDLEDDNIEIEDDDIFAENDENDNEEAFIDDEEAFTDEDEAFTDEDDKLKDYKKLTFKKKIKVRKNKVKKKASLGAKRTVKQRRKRKIVMLGMTGAVVLGIIISTIAIINKYTPTKEHMSGYSYYNVTPSEDVLILLNNEIESSTGIYNDGRLYLSSDFIAQKLNQRFYFDTESNTILYTTATDIYTFKTNDNTYTDSKGKTYTEDFNIVNEVNGKLYIDF